MFKKIKNKIPIEVSARHAHLTQENLEKLFGIGYKLNPIKELSQPGQFAAKETINVAGPKGELKRVRLIGPCRLFSQVEVSITEGRKLGDIPPVRVSGDIVGTPSVIIKGPKGEVNLNKGLICAQRHIHISPKEAKEFGLKTKQKVSVEIFGSRPLIFKDVIVRVHKNFSMSFQIDTDEGNAADVDLGDYGKLIV